MPRSNCQFFSGFRVDSPSVKLLPNRANRDERLEGIQFGRIGRTHGEPVADAQRVVVAEFHFAMA